MLVINKELALLIGLPLSAIAPLQRVQNAATHLLLGLPQCDHVRPALKELHWLPVMYRIKFNVALMMFTVHTRRCPDYLTDSVQACNSNRDGLVSARRPVLTILFHGQERNLATEPSLWPAQLYGTVYRQQFVKQTACICSSSSSKLIFYPLFY